jgi:hypothetical protein
MRHLVSVLDDEAGVATPYELAAVESCHDELRAGACRAAYADRRDQRDRRDQHGPAP